MLPASNKGVGMNIGFPDVCLTPMGPVPVPIPYPNFAMNAMATPFCATILLSCMPALNMGSMIPITLGMQPGVANPLYMMVGMYTMGNPKVVLQCLPGINLTCPTTGNSMNNAVGAVLVPSATNVFYTDAAASSGDRAPAARALTIDELRRMSDGLDAARAPAVTSELLAEGVGVVTIRRFASSVPSSVYHAIQALGAQGMTSLVLDLRDNPGGEMRAFVELASDFLAAGSLVVTEIDGDGDRVEHRSSHALDFPETVVLCVDRGTASAAELFAASLKAHRRAVVVGERTYGKGLAQAIVASREGDAIYGTVASFELPDGASSASIHETGVAPDVSWVAVSRGGDEAASRAAAATLGLSPRLIDALSALMS